MKRWNWGSNKVEVKVELICGLELHLELNRINRLPILLTERARPIGVDWVFLEIKKKKKKSAANTQTELY